MRYAAPIQVADEDEWITPDPAGGLPPPSPWHAPIVVDERDEAWNERAAAAMAGYEAGLVTPEAMADRLGVPLSHLRPAAEPGHPMLDYLAGTRDDMPTDAQLEAHARLTAADVAAMYDVPGEFVDPVLRSLTEYPGLTGNEPIGTEVTVGGIAFTKIGDNPFGPADADEMRTAIHDAETALATGHIVGNGPLTEPLRAAATDVALPPDWARQVDRATPFRDWPLDGRSPSEAGMPMPVVVEGGPGWPENLIVAGPAEPWTSDLIAAGPGAFAAALDLATPVPGRIEPVVFAPVRFAAPVIVDSDGATVPPKLAAKRQRMIDVVKAYAQADPRSNQVEIGPSEIGDPCDARVMRRALGFPAVTWPDPWASFVGTAVHAKLAEAFAAVNEANAGPARYLLERRVWMTDGMSGSTDLAELISTTEVTVEQGAPVGTVDIYDHKVLGTDTFRSTKAEKLAPTSKYGVQLDTYALGWRRAGYTVRTINLALWPRSGFLDGLLVIEREPDYGNAEAALDRVSALRQWALERGADEADEPWQDVPTAPGKGCGFCSYYNPHRPLGRESCDKGRDFMAGAKAGTGPRKATP
jgi:hypothetical protein